MQTGNHFSSFNHVQQDISNQPTKIFKQVLASDTQLEPAQQQYLETLLFSFPQCGLLRAIQARNGDTRQLSEAAAWFSDSTALQKIVKSPGNLPVVNPWQIIVRKAAVKPETPQAAPITEEPEEESYYEVIEENDVPPAEPEQLVADKTDAKFAPPIFKEEPFNETQQLIIENIAANDYFVFDKAFTDRNKVEPEAPKAPEPEPYKAPVVAKPVAPKATQLSPEEGSVTRYHDDKMPYSFMWWLDKTRNKHSSVYQPFANPAPPAGSIPPITENHVKEVLEERTTEEIVERFIQEEPQIKPPSSTQLDNENKGKQSEQDQEELITETLARIYADQMLYSKAIAAYKILMLKNPEKRRYFASQIENLQKKIN